MTVVSPEKNQKKSEEWGRVKTEECCGWERGERRGVSWSVRMGSVGLLYKR
jgi:hypothetical protein